MLPGHLGSPASVGEAEAILLGGQVPQDLALNEQALLSPSPVTSGKASNPSEPISLSVNRLMTAALLHLTGVLRTSKGKKLFIQQTYLLTVSVMLGTVPRTDKQ